MAFSQTPTQDTYSTHRVDLTREINARDGSQNGYDESYENVFIEPIKDRQVNDKRMFIVKRAGCTQQIASVSSSNVRGAFFWSDAGKYFYAVDDDVYVYTVATGASTTLSAVFGTSVGHVGFCTYLYDTNVVVLVATDGTTLVTIDTANTVTPCISADLPTPHLPFPVFLDGYLFLAKRNTADIYNSDLNDPLAWTPGNLIAAEMDGDYLIRIAKLNNYLLAMGTGTIEYFWDAGIETGSPLQRNDTPIKMNNYLAGFAQHGNDLYYIGIDSFGQPDVFMLKDFKIQNIGSPTISRYLNSCQDGTDNWTGSLIAFKGHTFYVIKAGSLVTWAYDLDTKQWAKWGFQDTTTFKFLTATLVESSTSAITYFSLIGGSTIYRFSDTLYRDNGTNFTCTVVTEANDFGSLNRKQMARLSVVGDRTSADSVVTISWSDDDYATWSSGVDVNLNQDLPCLYRLGSFRQRNFRLTYTDNYPLRIQSFEVNINKGIS